MKKKIATEIMKTIKQLPLLRELDCITEVRDYMENSNHRAHILGAQKVMDQRKPTGKQSWI